MIRHEALPSGDPLLCRTCRQKIFWVRDGDEERIYHHVSELLASDIPSALYSALRRIYPLPGVATLKRSDLYERVLDQGLAISSLEFLRGLDTLNKTGRIRIVRTLGGPDTIEVVR